MSSLNRFCCSARFVVDPELRFTPQEKPIAAFRVAIDCGWGDREETLFLSGECWGARGEALAKHFKKGDAILLDGRLKPNDYVLKDGSKRHDIRLTVENWAFCGAKKEKETDDGSEQDTGAEGNERHASRGTRGVRPEKTARDAPDDDLPF